MRRRLFISLRLLPTLALLGVVACGPGAPPPQPAKPAASQPTAAPKAAEAKPAATQPAAKPAAEAKPAAATPSAKPGGQAATSSPRWGGTLVVGLTTEPKFLNVNYDFDGAAPYQNMNVYSKLLNFDYPTGTLHPDLAESWDISADELTYTFKLRNNVKWHDGKEFTSADVVWTYQDILNEGTKATTFNLIKDVESVSAPDASTVVFKLKGKNAAFLMNLASYYGANILPKHIYEGTDARKNPANQKPIGTGPFKLVEFVPGSHFTYEAYPGYHGEGPYLDKLIFRVIPNLATQMAAIESGEIGYAAGSPPFGDVPRMRNVPGLKIDESGSNINQWIALNLDHERLKDVRVRRALAHAIDTQALATQVYGGLVKPSTATYTTSVPWAYNPDAKQPAYDPAAAEKLLDEAGLTRGADGTRLKLRYSAWISSIWGGKELAEVVKQQLARVGVDVSVEVAEFALFNEKIIKRREFDLTGSGGPHGPDPNEFRNFVGTGGNRNVMNYSNPRVDELFQLGVGTTKQDERRKYYFEIQQIVAQDVPRINLVEYAYMRPYRANYHDFWWQPVATEKKIAGDMYNLTWMDEGSTTPRPKS